LPEDPWNNRDKIGKVEHFRNKGGAGRKKKKKWVEGKDAMTSKNKVTGGTNSEKKEYQTEEHT